MPPPASHIEKPLMWWSRPLPCAIGVRPNSPPQMTSVSSSMPRCFRSLISAAARLSTSLAATCDVVLDAAVVVPVAVIELDEAHAALGQPPGQQAVGRERAVAALACRTGRASPSARSTGPSGPGTLVCMRNAISYWRCAWRSPGRRPCRSAAGSSACTASTTSRCRLGVDARRGC